MEIIPVSVFYIVWTKRNRRAFDRFKDVNDLDIRKNRWSQALSFFHAFILLFL